jgi:hypothetical protein
MPSHVLRKTGEDLVTCRPTAFLALADLDSYPSFVGAGTDHLDLLAHLSRQTQALTAVMWETPPLDLKLRFLLTGGYRAQQDLEASHHQVAFSGWVRTNGRLALSDEARLLACARDEAESPTVSSRTGSPKLWLVVPGLYAVTVFNRPRATTEADYTVLLRHYPHPALRPAPVRLGSMIPWAA